MGKVIFVEIYNFKQQCRSDSLFLSFSFQCAGVPIGVKLALDFFMR